MAKPTNRTKLGIVIQRIVQRTVRVPVLSTLYRLHYRLAFFSFCFLTRFRSPVRCILLRRSFAGATWVPGYSDIDTVLVLSNISAEREVRFLYKLDRRLRCLRWIFPFLSFPQIVDESALDMWLRLGGARRLEVNDWRQFGSLKRRGD